MFFEMCLKDSQGWFGYEWGRIGGCPRAERQRYFS